VLDEQKPAVRTGGEDISIGAVDAGDATRQVQIPPVDDDDMRAALRRLFAVTGASFEQRSHLERALRTRIVIEQAKGVLAERLRVTMDEAFQLLRGTARSSRRRLHDLAEEVIAQPETPPAIAAALPSLLAQIERPGAPE
jgi:ANTAR domain